MTYKTHLSSGLLSSSLVFLLLFNINLSPQLAFLLILSTVLGSSVPDLDTPTGELWQKIPAGGVLSRLIHPIFLGGHRHLSHSLIGFAIFTALFSLLAKHIPFDPLLRNAALITLAFALGYLSHLLADSFTESGVPLLFPRGYHFGLPPVASWRIKTGHWFENLIIYPIINLSLLYLLFNYLKQRL